MKIINIGREILLLGSVRESIMTPSETSSEKIFVNYNLSHQGPLHCFWLSLVHAGTEMFKFSASARQFR
jgi:hypothetical protein